VTKYPWLRSVRKLNTPEQLRGRVPSINVLLTQGSKPIGGFFLGSLGRVAGVATANMTFAVLCLFGVGVAVTYRWRTAHATPQTT
jgi:hypothetical protein